ncbi:hypothetical protein [Streptomyces beijiangensis]|uniref:Adhesin domain-containing protein n=1 Tax=Streptomyces beijiangensis TaxID=163361 RepID=A0A939FBW6_9ACTN|nr:hypothetical protein [Streptomyces beijiangensis]MBO0516426.1 hypothetical protein [Streptomyces beijiangensis]
MSDDTTRRRFRGPWITVAVLSALFIVAPVGAEAWAQLARQSHSYTSTETTEQHRVRAVEVDGGSSDVSVSAGTDNAVKIHQELSWSLRRPVVHRSWDGDTLKVSTACDGVLALTSLGCEIKLELAVPAGISVKVVNSSGPVRVSGLAGPLDVRSTSGSVQLYGVRGPVKAKVGSGSVKGVALGSPTVDARAGSGQVSLDFAAPPRELTGSVGAGEFAATVPPGSRYRVQGSTGSGSREIDSALTEPASDLVIDASSGSGTVRIGYPGR